MQDYELEDIQQENESGGFGGIEWFRLFLAIRKSVIWLLIFLVISILGGYYYLKYTKPVFKASSIIKLDIQAEGIDIGIGVNPFAKQMDNLSGEIELIKSPLVASEVVQSLDIGVYYSAVGKVLTTEIYKTNPFKLSIFSNEESIAYDKDFYVRFVSSSEFKLFTEDENGNSSKTFKIGELINLDGFKFALIWNTDAPNIGNQKEYIFKINSHGKLVSYLLSSVTVEVLNKDARTISISFTDYNKDKAVDIVNAFDSVYLKHSLSKKQISQEQTIAFIENQLENTSRKLEDSEKDVETFIRTYKTTSPGSEFAGVIEKIQALEEGKVLLVSQAKQLENIVNFIQKESVEENIVPLVSGIENTQITNGINALNSLYKDKEMLKISSKSTTTPFRKIELEISIIKSQLLDYIVESKKTVVSKIQEIDTQISKFKNSFEELPSLETELNRLKRYNSLYEKFYLSLLDKQIQYQISKAGTVPEFTILSPARASSDPIHPDTKKIWLYFLAGGFLPGVLMMVARYALMNLILDPRDVEKKIKAPILGLVPSYKKKMDASTLVVDHNPKSSISESLRSIRSNADFILPDKPNHLIGVTSTISGEGKTMFAINYAAVMALSGKKVVILDFDMRKPKIHVGFGVPNNIGCSTILVGQTKWQDAVKKTRLANLDYITSGPTPPNPSELILRKEFDQLIFELFEHYDVVMIDTPPIGLVTDASAILNKTDLSVYVIRSGYSHKNTINNVNKLYASKKLKNLSVVINDIKLVGSYGYKYNYGYGYGYGYGYYDEDNKPKGFLSRFSKKK